MNTEEVRKTEEWKSNMKWRTRGGHRVMWRAIVGWGGVGGGWNIQMLLCLCPLNEAGAKTATHHSGNWNAHGQTRASSMSDNHSICFLSPSYTISAVKKPILSTASGFSEPLLEIRLTLTSFFLMNIYKGFTLTMTLSKKILGIQGKSSTTLVLNWFTSGL